MINNTTELVFVLDRSGSMNGLQSDTIGGFNSLIEKQKREDGIAYVTTVLFDTRFERIHDRLPLNEVQLMTEKDYVPGGCTALLDAIGSTIHHISHIHKYAREEDVPDNTIFVITTDGMENSSHKYTAEKVKKMIGKKKDKGWEFLFLGANIDAVQTASSFGIDKKRAVNYHSDKAGTALNFACMGKALSSVRAKGCLEDAWREEIDEDFASRS